MAMTLPQAQAQSSYGAKPQAFTAIRNGVFQASLGTNQRYKVLPIIFPTARHRLRPRIDNIRMAANKPTLRRLARRAGVFRIKADIYETMRTVLRRRLTEILECTTNIVIGANRKTITTSDIVFALRTLGSPIYGFEARSEVHQWPESRAQYMRKKRTDQQREKALIDARIRTDMIQRMNNAESRMSGVRTSDGIWSSSDESD